MKRQLRNKLIAAAVTLLFLAFFVWWGSFDSIRDILSDPASCKNDTVRLFGRTGSAYNVPFVGGLYGFSDTSGGMWVITDRDSTAEGRMMYIEATVCINPDEEVLKLKGKLQKLLDRDIFEGGNIPPILVEKGRGGLVASMKAVRAKK